MATPSFSELLYRNLAWRKTRPFPGLDPSEWGLDELGNLIRYSEFGNRNSPHGWEKDHRMPLDLGGSDDLSNIRPLHWRANVAKSNHLPFPL